MDLIKLNTSQLLLTSLLTASNSEMGNFYETGNNFVKRETYICSERNTLIDGEYICRGQRLGPGQGPLPRDARPGNTGL